MRLACAMLSKPGGREVNEDALGGVAPQPGLGCWALADGQGKRGGGDVAAQKTVQAMLDTFAARPEASEGALEQAVQAAQRAIAEMQAEIVRNQSLRVAAALLCTDGRVALWAHIGNVRVYAFRNGALLAHTKDHSVTQTLVNAGEISPSQIRQHPDHHRLLRAIGIPGTVQPTLSEQSLPLRAGDLFLICSVGFWRHVTELEMLADWCKSSTPEKWLEYLELRLLKAAPADCDNYSAIALLAELDS